MATPHNPNETDAAVIAEVGEILKRTYPDVAVRQTTIDHYGIAVEAICGDGHHVIVPAHLTDYTDATKLAASLASSFHRTRGAFDEHERRKRAV